MNKHKPHQGVFARIRPKQGGAGAKFVSWGSKAVYDSFRGCSADECEGDLIVKVVGRIERKTEIITLVPKPGDVWTTTNGTKWVFVGKVGNRMYWTNEVDLNRSYVTDNKGHSLTQYGASVILPTTEKKSDELVVVWDEEN